MTKSLHSPRIAPSFCYYNNHFNHLSFIPAAFASLSPNNSLFTFIRLIFFQIQQNTPQYIQYVSIRHIRLSLVVVCLWIIAVCKFILKSIALWAFMGKAKIDAAKHDDWNGDIWFDSFKKPDTTNAMMLWRFNAKSDWQLYEKSIEQVLTLL